MPHVAELLCHNQLQKDEESHAQRVHFLGELDLIEFQIECNASDKAYY
jgi:hypothetical protein